MEVIRFSRDSHNFVVFNSICLPIPIPNAVLYNLVKCKLLNNKSSWIFEKKTISIRNSQVGLERTRPLEIVYSRFSPGKKLQNEYILV